MIRILLYDDVQSLRETLVMLLSATEGFEVVGQFDNCETASADVSALHPDVVLMDIDMPAVTGIEGVKAIRKQHQDVKIIMLTVFDDNRNIFDSIRFGANGYLLKKSAPEAIVSAIRDVYNGGAPMNAAIATQVLKMFAGMSAGSHDYDLSEREKEVLQSLVDGNSYKMVAASLAISIDTVRTHIRSIYEKLQVNSKSEAVAKAIKNRIV
ncbi:MAG: response regulator transcription factor [Agriterribacter sp.]